MLREHSFVNHDFPVIDEEISVDVRIVTPSRTFLEKLFLLSEEFQKEKPRSRRMSRHLYDIERIMETDFGKEALRNTELYKAIVAHREKFYHLGYVDYNKDLPDKICFVPKGAVLEAYRKDYEENMVDGYIYNEALPFDILISHLEELQKNIRAIKL